MTIEEKTIQDEKDRTIELKGSLKVEDYLSILDIWAQKTLCIVLELISVSIFFYFVRSQLCFVLSLYPFMAVVYVLAILVLLILTTRHYEKVLPRNNKKVLQKSNMRNEQTYTINSKTITREIEGTILQLSWSDIKRTKEFTDIFHINLYNKRPNVLYISKNKFSNSSGKLKLDNLERELTLRIPKRFFQNESDIIYFKELLEKNVPLNRKCYKSN